MIVIADATPLRYLIEVDCYSILPQLFGRVLIPQAVASELQHEQTPEMVREFISNPPPWLEIRTLNGIPDPSLRHLGIGEQEAILLAEETSADWIILDDREGRQAAARRHIQVLGTLRVIDEAAARGWIDPAEILDRLHQTTFYISPRLAEWLLDRHAKRGH